MSESKATGAVARNLSEIKADLRTALKSQTANGVVIGGLLREAKRGLKHGEWGMWLQANFALSERSTQHYMAASEFASKYKKFADFKLRLTGICALTKYDQKTIAAVLKVARTKWLCREGVDRVAEEFRQSENARLKPKSEKPRSEPKSRWMRSLPNRTKTRPERSRNQGPFSIRPLGYLRFHRLHLTNV
jgi:DUF3102 family protein